jgi:hypothetical protein
MRTIILMLAVAVLVCAGGEAGAAPSRRTVRCCVDVPTGDVTSFPWCFNIRARSRRVGRRICRAVGGRPPGQGHG